MARWRCARREGVETDSDRKRLNLRLVSERTYRSNVVGALARRRKLTLSGHSLLTKVMRAGSPKK
jgi:hypothetical protein